ncbi:MAG TPA: hypothetical protein VJY63_04630 [Marinospirillum sp.]|uniref:hypothetical protein n=1 Tax=Marinospirillum sp. TaxID=2183934 RepID=UPI002B480BF7|nr:hypothetical protein [Marinospirillum sp.]HKM15197.1 hypothetical protein [Marinospirillum sp.]
MNSIPDKRKTPYPINLLILITLVGILLAIWYVTNYLHTKQAGQVTWYSAASCQLPQDTCFVKLDGQKHLTFRLDKQEPKPLESLPIRVQLEGYSEEELKNLQLEIDLQGRDMYMGYNRTPMIYQGEGLFTANPILSICTEAVMVWRASVLINNLTTSTTYGSYFDFTVKS